MYPLVTPNPPRKSAMKKETDSASAPVSTSPTPTTTSVSMPMPTPKTKKSRRGFAGWSPEKQAEVARQGGIAAHANGKGHEFTAEEARAAGRKGGLAAQAAKKRAAERVAERV